MSQENSPFGVLEFLHWNHDWNNYKYPSAKEIEQAAKLMVEAGIAWVRMDFLWGDIEPEAGKFDFAKYDTIVQILSRYNINILGVLHYSADWASSCGRWNCPPADNRQFVKYCVEVAKRYKGQVRYWEIWNEPDSRVYWEPQDGLKSYCKLLKDAACALRNVDSGCKILNGGLASGVLSVNRLYENGAGEYFDILNIHIFQSPVTPDSIKAVTANVDIAYKIMKRNHDQTKKIWITEIGCPGVKRGIPVKDWWMGKNPTEKQQAEWIKKVYTELLKRAPVEKVFWAFFRDCRKHWDNGTDYFGLVRWDYSKKKAFDSYRGCSRKWSDENQGQ